MTEPLTIAQKMFNQRLLAQHCMTEEEARTLWNEIAAVTVASAPSTALPVHTSSSSSNRKTRTSTGSAAAAGSTRQQQQQQQRLEDALVDMNGQLQYVGLEIVGISMMRQNNNDQESSTPQPSQTKSSKSTPKSTQTKSTPKPSQVPSTQQKQNQQKQQMYYVMRNKSPDDIVKNAFWHQYTELQHIYVRTVIHQLVEQGPLKRSTLLNSRLNADDTAAAADDDNNNNITPSQTNKSNKTITLPAAEAVLDSLLQEKWIENVGSHCTYALSPRAYAELSYLLVKEFGMGPDELPQQIFYR